METTAYVLGMLTITLIAMISVIVVGIVKIIKLQKQVKQSDVYFEKCIQNIHQTERENLDHIHRRIDDMQINLQRGISEVNGEMWRQFEITGKDITMVDKTLQNKMENELKGVHTNTKRYIDSRIDKLVDTYFEVMGSKKMIKG